MEMKKIVFSILMLLVSVTSAQAWSDKQIKGMYRCLGQGVIRGENFTWAAFFKANGKGNIAMADALRYEDGTGTDPTVSEGTYSVTKDSGLISFSGTSIEGMLVQKGKGILLEYSLGGGLFSRQCWREK